MRRDRVMSEDGEFSLVVGGPLFQLLRRAHLSDEALTLVRQRIVVFSLVTWLPLLVLSALEGKLVGGNAGMSFLLDIEAHARFLVAMPLLVVAELVVHQRMRFLLAEFLERNLIPDRAIARFKASIASECRLRNSVLAEVLLVGLVYVGGVLIVWRHYISLDAPTWYATPLANGSALSFAGLWYGYVSLPIFQFLLCRWYFRIFIWIRFLWQVSRIDLSLVAAHPDRVGGLGFLSETIYAFVPLLLAHGVLLAGLLGNRIVHLGAGLPSFMLEILVLVMFLVCLVLGPFLVFSPQLARVKRVGLREYGALAERYVRTFDAKWLRGGAPAEEPLVGSADIQSLADLGNSFEIVRTMRVLPFSKEAIIQLTAVTLAPLAPLLLTMMSLEEILKKLVGIVF